MSENDVVVGFEADLSGISKGFNDAAGKINSGANDLKGTLNGIGASVLNLQNMFLGLGTTILSGFGMQKAIQDTIDTTYRFDKMSNMLGKSVAEVRDLDDALSISGSSLEAYSGVVRMVTMRINSNEKAYKDAGVAIRDQNNELLPTSTIISNLTKRLEDYKAGQDRNTMAMRLAGRGYRELIELQRMDLVDKEKLKAGNEALTKVIGEVGVEAVIKYNTAMQDIKDVIEAAQRVIATSFMPIMARLGEWFGNIGPVAVDVFKSAIELMATIINSTIDLVVTFGTVVLDVFSAVGGAAVSVFSAGSPTITGLEFFKNVIKSVQIAIIGFRVAVEEMVNIVKGALALLVAKFMLVGYVAKEALTPGANWSERIQSAYKKGLDGISAVISGAQDDILSTARKGKEDIDRALFGTSEVSGGKKDGTLSATAKPTAGAASDKRFTTWKEQLNQLKQSENNFFQDTLSMEEKFWSDKLATVSTRGKENVKLRQQINTELYNIHKQQAIQIRQLDEEVISSAERAGMQGVESMRANIATQRAMKTISAEQEVNALVEVADIEYSLKLNTLNRNLELYKDEKVKKAQILNQIKELDAKHAADVNKIYSDAAKQRYEEQMALEAAEIDHKSEMAKADVEAARYRNSMKLELGYFSAEEEAAMATALSNQLYEIESQTLNDKLEFYKEDELKYQALLDQKALLAKKHALDLEKIQGEAVLKNKEQMEQMMAPLTQAIETSVKGMILGTTTWRKALHNIFQSILGEFISMLAKMATKWLISKMMMTTVSKAMAAEEMAIEQTQMIAKAVSSKLAAAASIAQAAGIAGANGVASYALAPWPINMGAPAFGAAMSAASMSYMGVLGAFETGAWQIPKDQIALLHKDETVLNKKDADEYRSGNSGTGGGSMIVNISAVDAAGVKRLFDNHGVQLADSLRKQSRNFKPMTPRERNWRP